jgi:hypothetical protein
MRTQVTFILRLWIDPQAEPPAWEGQVECIADGERAHVRGAEELAHFVAVHALPPGTPRQEEIVNEKGDHP